MNAALTACRCSAAMGRGLSLGSSTRSYASLHARARQHCFRAFASAAAAPSGSPSMPDRLKKDMISAMKAKESVKLDTIRGMSAAIKQREIELRESGTALSDEEALKVLQKLAKQRKDSIAQYTDGGRQDLADKEAQELAVIDAYLPAQLSREDVEAIVARVVAEVGATSVKDMGKVMKAVQARTAGAADNKLVGELVKAQLAKK